MRSLKLFLAAIGGLWLAGAFLATSAQAVPLLVDTDPVPFSGDITDSKFLSGEVDLLSIESDRLELKVFVDQKGFSRFGVLAVDSGGGLIQFTDAGIIEDQDLGADGELADCTRICCTSRQFRFGLASSISATTPATCGAAAEVPPNSAV